MAGPMGGMYDDFSPPQPVAVTMKIPEILLVESEHKPGSLAKILKVIGDAGLVVEHLNVVKRDQDKTTWEITLEWDDQADHGVLEAIDALPNARLLGRSDRVFNRHIGGKIKMVSKLPIASIQQLRDVYTPGVARVCLAIQRDPALARLYTSQASTVAIVTNGTAVLGLGDIGVRAAMPVMEGKAALFARLVGLSGVPILVDSQDPDEIVRTVVRIAPSFGAIQLEDIAAPACFEVEQRLREALPMPVLHDDQHGTAVVALAALLSATTRVGVDLCDSVVGVIGLGAAGFGISRLLRNFGVKQVLGSDIQPAAMARLEEQAGGRGLPLPELMRQAEVVVATTGVPGLIKPEMIRPGQVVLALSNPDPEIRPQLALQAGAAFAADGGSINNALGFPGLFKGTLDAGVSDFSDAMLFAAAQKIAELAPEDSLVPAALDTDVHAAVAEAVRAAASAGEAPASACQARPAGTSAA